MSDIAYLILALSLGVNTLFLTGLYKAPSSKEFHRVSNETLNLMDKIASQCDNEKVIKSANTDEKITFEYCRGKADVISDLAKIYGKKS